MGTQSPSHLVHQMTPDQPLYPFGHKFTLPPSCVSVLDKTILPYHQSIVLSKKKFFAFKRLVHPNLVPYKAVFNEAEFCSEESTVMVLYQFVSRELHPGEVSRQRLIGQLLDLASYMQSNGLSARWQRNSLGLENGQLKVFVRYIDCQLSQRTQKQIQADVQDFVQSLGDWPSIKMKDEGPVPLSYPVNLSPHFITDSTFKPANIISTGLIPLRGSITHDFNLESPATAILSTDSLLANNRQSKQDQLINTLSQVGEQQPAVKGFRLSQGYFKLVPLQQLPRLRSIDIHKRVNAEKYPDKTQKRPLTQTMLPLYNNSTYAHNGSQQDFVYSRLVPAQTIQCRNTLVSPVNNNLVFLRPNAPQKEDGRTRLPITAMSYIDSQQKVRRLALQAGSVYDAMSRGQKEGRANEGYKKRWQINSQMPGASTQSLRERVTLAIKRSKEVLQRIG